MSDDDEKKTRRLDDNYFKEIAQQIKTQKLDSDKTQILGSKSNLTNRDENQGGSLNDAENRTRVFQSPGDLRSSSASFGHAMDDPPTAWLVAVGGPGKGTVMTLGVGLNSIGRGTDPRVSIPFEDDSISRGKCFVVVYDPLNRTFFVTPGEGKALTYIDTQPVLEKTELASGMELKVGKSTFRFIALCGHDFDWAIAEG